MKYKLLIPLTFFTIAVFAQVDQIKNRSSENSSRKEGSGGSYSSGGPNIFAFFDVFRFVGDVQSAVLAKRDSTPRIISFEAFAQAAIQPSNYYLVNPRVRGKWGIFSTDFRFNWLIEQNIGGNKELSTFDWQIIQLNLINTRSVTGRVGVGNYYENFGSHQSFFEATFGVSVFPSRWPVAANAEYRVSNDFTTGAVPRREFNFSLERPLFTAGRWHGNATLGGVYQRYYEAISVWGIQAGFAFRIY